MPKSLVLIYIMIKKLTLGASECGLKMEFRFCVFVYLGLGVVYLG